VIAGVWALTPHPLRREIFDLHEWAATWRGTPMAPLIASTSVALAANSMVPMALLVALCGFVLGPWVGFETAFAGALVGAVLGYAIGARLRRDTSDGWSGAASTAERSSAHGRCARAVRDPAARARAVCAINVVAGATRFPLRGFLLASVLALAPGTLALAAIGHGRGARDRGLRLASARGSARADAGTGRGAVRDPPSPSPDHARRWSVAWSAAELAPARPTGDGRHLQHPSLHRQRRTPRRGFGSRA
jgi:uncharacterized membrane protein YdjX (TVP38/TMEM64 family)